MVVEFIMNLIFALVDSIVNLMPVSSTAANDISGFFELWSIGMAFFPSDVILVAIPFLVFWTFAQLSWSFIEWVYHKLPGIT